MTPPTIEATTFIGRRREIAAVRQLLATARLLTLTGVGGAGKTRLASEVARRCVDPADALFDAGWIVRLGDVEDPLLVGFEAVESLGVPIAVDQTPVDALAVLFDDQDALLVLDNCEQVVGACARLVSTLLERCPRLTVLATSRQSLGVSGEQVYDVPPLAVPLPGQAVRLGELQAFDGVRLFLDRATSASPGFDVTEAGAWAVAQLCTELEGLPLALELAAAGVAAMTPEGIVSRLRGQSAPDPTGVPRQGDAQTRHASVEASLAWSYDLCTEQERLLWQRLSVFSGGFGLDAAQHVGSGAGLEVDDVLDALIGLIDKSLVVRDPEGVHHRMLETIRRYGAARLAESGAVATTRRRHRQWFEGRAMVLGLEWMGPHQGRWVEHWRRNQANLRLLLESMSDDPQDAPAAIVLVMALEGYWLVTGRFAEARHWLDRALSTAIVHGTGNQADLGAAFSMAAYLGGIQGDEAYAERQLDRAGEILRGFQDGLVLGYHAFAAGSMHLFQGDMEAALREVSRSIDPFRSVGHVNHVPVALLIVAMCHQARDEHDEAQRAQVECLAMTEAAGELYARSLLLWQLAHEALEFGHHDEAVGLLIRSLVMKSALRDVPGVALVLEGLAAAEVRRGHAQRAARLLGAAEATWRFEMADPLAAPFAADRRESARAEIVAALGQDTFAAVLSTGRIMGIDDAVAYAMISASGPDPVPDTTGSPLSRREAQVAGLVAAGLTDADIASRLVISVHTVQGHLGSLLAKLELSSRSGVAAWVASRENVDVEHGTAHRAVPRSRRDG